MNGASKTAASSPHTRFAQEAWDYSKVKRAERLSRAPMRGLIAEATCAWPQATRRPRLGVGAIHLPCT